jgi:hypothetical protein
MPDSEAFRSEDAKDNGERTRKVALGAASTSTHIDEFQRPRPRAEARRLFKHRLSFQILFSRGWADG